VVRETKSFGTVNIDHAAHLARRAACGACHVSGRVGKIKFETPRMAHEACRGCHVTVSKGPTECRGCHVVGPDEGIANAVAAATPPPASAQPGSPGPAGTLGPPGTPAAGTAASGPPPEAGLDEGLASRSRILEIGVAAMASGRQGSSLAPSFTLVGGRGDLVLSHTLVLGGVTKGRTQFLVGLGRAWPVRKRVRGAVEGLVGIDATQSPVFMSPAVGVRAGFDLERGYGVVETLGVSLSCVAAVIDADTVGEKSGQVSVGLTLSGGFGLPR
jgi:hypothetical protein